MNSIPQRRVVYVSLAQQHAYRAKHYGARGAFTDDEWFQLCEKHDNLCLCCGEAKPLTVDHVIPLYSGGTNFIHNIQCLCRECNTKKGTRTIDYRPAEEGFIPTPFAPSPKKVIPAILGPSVRLLHSPENKYTAPYLLMACRVISGNSQQDARNEYKQRQRDMRLRDERLGFLKGIQWELLSAEQLDDAHDFILSLIEKSDR